MWCRIDISRSLSQGNFPTSISLTRSPITSDDKWTFASVSFYPEGDGCMPSLARSLSFNIWRPNEKKERGDDPFFPPKKFMVFPEKLLWERRKNLLWSGPRVIGQRRRNPCYSSQEDLWAFLSPISSVQQAVQCEREEGLSPQQVEPTKERLLMAKIPLLSGRSGP